MKNFIKTYFKIIALILVVVGLSFSVTSLNGLYGVLFADNIVSENTSIILMLLGILMPISMLIFGIYLYFSLDYKVPHLKMIIIIFTSIFTIVGLFYIIGLFNEYEKIFKKLFETSYFLNEIYGYITFILGIGLLYGIVNYKYLSSKRKVKRKEMNNYEY